MPTSLPLGLSHLYVVTCRDKFGRLKWQEIIPNLVTTVGRNDVLQQYYTGTTYTAAHFVGLKGVGTVAAGDTMASHAGWSEVTSYDEATRQPLSMGTASSGSINNSASRADFTINATVSVAGAFIGTNGTKGGTTGVLVGAADFSQVRNLVDDDTLSVQITASIAAS